MRDTEHPKTCTNYCILCLKVEERKSITTAYKEYVMLVNK